MEDEMSKIKMNAEGFLFTAGDLKGEDGVLEALPILVKIARELDKLKLMEEEEIEPFKTQVGEIASRYKELRACYVEMDEALRKMVLEEHEGTDSIKVEGVGELVFPERWTYYVENIDKVERKFLTADNAEINKAIKNGARKIKGVVIFQKRGLTVRKEAL